GVGVCAAAAPDHGHASCTPVPITCWRDEQLVWLRLKLPCRQRAAEFAERGGVQPGHRIGRFAFEYGHDEQVDLYSVERTSDARHTSERCDRRHARIIAEPLRCTFG